MILSTLSFGMHMLVSSFRLLGPVGQVLEYVLPQYRNMSTKAVKGKINFNTKHLKKGDPLPPYNGKLRVYNMRYCPYAQRTILALNAKEIDYEVVNINLNEKPEWLVQKSAFAKVPALEVAENVSIYESLITVEYLDDVYAERPLLSKDPVKRAFDKIIVEACSPIHALIYKAVRFPDSVTEENIEQYEKALHFAQNQLKARGTPFFGGNEPGYADYMTWPWFERILILQKKYNVLKFDTEKFKLLVGYFNWMLQDPAVSQYAVPEDILFKYIDLYSLGQPDYDMLLE